MRLVVRSLTERHQALVVSVLAYLITWLILMPYVLGGTTFAAIPLGLRFVAGCGGSLAGLVTAALAGGGKGVKELLRRVVLWRVGWRWYLAAILGPPAIFAAGLAARALLGLPAWAAPGDPLEAVGFPGLSVPARVAFAFLLNILVMGGLPEELGWRGVALPALQRRHSALVASLILGLVHGFWHLPGLLIPGSFQSATAIVPYVFGLLPWTILWTWLFNNTRGSLLLAILWHASLNTCSVAFPLPPGDPVVIGVSVVAAVAVLVLAGPARLAPAGPGVAEG